MKLSKLENVELVNMYGDLIKELRIREIIRTKNIVGDIGEYLAINHYATTKGLPKLQAVPTSTKSVDAISINGERYSIKTTTNKTTGVFYGLNSPSERKEQTKLFEYVIIVTLNEFYNLEKIIEMDWEQFLKYKKWHKRMNAWNININNDILNNTKIIYNSEC